MTRPPHSPVARKYVVSFTEHKTFEIEVIALSEDNAIEKAADCRSRFGLEEFTLLEHDVTDWFAVALTTESLAMTDHVPAPPPSLTPSPRYMSTDELQSVLRLLREVRDTTQSQASYQDASRMISIILNVDGAR